MDEKQRKKFTGQMKQVAEYMADGEFRTLDEIGKAIRNPNWGSCASRLRDLKAYFGYGYEKVATGQDGVYAYRLYKVNQGQLKLFEAA